MSAAAVELRRAAPRVPSELLDLAQWCLWGLHEGRKRPMALAGYWGSSTNPETWGEYGDAVDALQRVTNAEGLGFVFTEADPYTGVDLDDCLDAAGRLKPWAVEILRRLAGTYAEVSPSGSGIKLWCRGRLESAAKFAYGDGAVEMYSTARFFAVTGNIWPGALLEIAEAQESIDWLLSLNPAGLRKAPFVLPPKIARGTQHNTLLSFAGAMRKKGLEQPEIEAALIVASKRCEVVPPEAHMVKMAASVCKWPPGPSPEFGGPVEQNVESPSSEAAEPDYWPEPLNNLAFIGLAGDVVRMIEPHTESDPAALLFQFLAMFGNIIGRKPYWMVEDTRHFTNIFTCIVGDTAKARKGTGFDRVRKVFEGVDPEWDGRVLAGLSSGEGLIWAVRDPIIDMVPVKEKGKPPVYEEQMVDSGVQDKRLLVVEAEFARVLNAGQRQGNTLTAVMREAWDGRRLGLLTKAKAATCKEPHVSIISHITRAELLRCLTDTEAANGYANRFLFVCARRSKSLPFGGERLDYEPIHSRLRTVIATARDIDEVGLDADAREIWQANYDELSNGEEGLLGMVAARAEAHVRRLACLYALLDESAVVTKAHLLAALACWKYAHQSCKAIFGDALGDPTADEILALLKRSPDGVPRTEISNHLQRHKKREDIAAALQTLLRTNRARHEIEKTAGRPVERWFAV
ncbi:MAG: DUF3987 domain-containing protein [Acidobacteriaceae bacterium]|nr:DUF3987 domain-containing protein [Acidobacteriaceae bacterium]